MKPILALALVCGLLVAGPVAAQWQWQDSSGKKVFSDQPPPPDIPERNILQRPHRAAAPAPAAAAPAAAAPASAASAKGAADAAPKLSGTDKELEERKRQADNAEAAKRKAQEEAAARARAENCNRARQAKASYDSGVRIARTNAQGEREYIDDAARAAETRRLQGIIASDCR